VQNLSWETPRNASEIGMVMRTSILRQWMIPSITFDDNANEYDIDEQNSCFVVSGIRTRYRVTIEEIGE
jgi:hypothetical protein